MNPFLPGYSIDNDWCYAGGEGTVRKCRCRATGDVFAVKSSSPTEQESHVLSLFDHANIIKLHEVISDGIENHLILEYATGGDYFDLISSQPQGYLSESEAKVHFLHLLGALDYIHTNGVVHFDVKPENIFILESGLPALGDFGLAVKADDVNRIPLRATGSLLYTPPEILLRTEFLTSAVDIWSLGVTLYMALTGCFPFEASDDIGTARAILKASPSYPRHLSKESISVLKRMLCPQPEKRATVEELVAHPWFESLFAYIPMERLAPNLVGLSPKFRHLATVALQC